MMHINILKRLQVIWWGFRTRDECALCGRGRFNWSCFKPAWGKYPEHHPDFLVFHWAAWGPVEIRYFPRKP